MGAGLPTKLVPVLVGGGLDTKTDPRLVPAGSLLELENMWMLRTGELRVRNGFTSKTKAVFNNNPVGSAAAIVPVPSVANALDAPTVVQTGVLGLLGGTSTATSSRQFFRLTESAAVQAGSAAAGWTTPSSETYPMASATASVAGVNAAQSTTGTVVDLVDCDSCSSNGYLLTCWTEQAGAGEIFASLMEEQTGIQVQVQSSILRIASGVTGRRARCAAGGTNLCAFYLDNAGTPSLKVKIFSLTTLAASTVTVALNLVNAAQPWFDVMTRAGGSTIMVAYRASAGGVTCLEFDPASGTTVAGPVNTAGADASMALAWLRDTNSVASAFVLATAGSGSGVVSRVMSTALAVTATNVIDATATAGIRNMTGLEVTANGYFVLWDVDATPTYNMMVKKGTWTGSASVSNLALSFGLASHAFQGSDLLNYVLLSYDSTVQATFVLLNFSYTTPVPVATVMAGNAGGRTVATNVLSSPYKDGSQRACMALARKQKITASNGSFLTTRSVAMARFSLEPTPRRPRELGGTMFFPGGIPLKYDRALLSWATIPFAPEAVTCVSSATGSMTASGSYDYFSVYKRTDAQGRVIRSPPSVATTVVLGAGDGRVTVSVKILRFQPVLAENVVVEFYRRGPSATGATAINKVGETVGDATGAPDTVSFVDSISDTAAAAGELLYTTGGILENFSPPSHSLLEVCNRRVWVVNAEDPTELWPSKEYKPGLGIGFHSLLAFRVTGDGFGAITALAAMDGRLIVFKSSAIYVVTGDGPDDSGKLGSFNPPQAVSLNLGTSLPGSVVATPAGIMFQSAKGIYLLDRGLGLTYLGKAVEQYTLAANVVDASLVDNATQVRFVMASGRCLVWDYDQERWATFLLPVGSSSVVACANITSGVSGGWCYALADGTVKQEVSGQFSDDGAAIVPRVGLPNINLAGISGFQRLRSILILGEYVGAHELHVDISYDYGTFTETRMITVNAETGSPFQFELRPGRQRCTSVQITIRAAGMQAGSGAFRLTGVTLRVGVKRGPVPYLRRLT